MAVGGCRGAGAVDQCLSRHACCCVAHVQDVSAIDNAERTREFQSKGEWVGENDISDAEVRRSVVVCCS